MGVLHAAVLAQCQPLASSLQLFGALVRLFTGLQAFGCCFVGLGHGAVSGDILFNFFLAVLGQSAPGQTHGEDEKSDAVHGFP